MIRELLCMLGLHSFKWEKPFDETYIERYRILGGVKIQLDQPHEYAKTVQDGTCIYCGKIKRVFPDD